VDLRDRDSAGIRPHRNAGQEVPQEKRLVESLGDVTPGQCGYHDNGKIGCDSHTSTLLLSAPLGNSTTGDREDRIVDSKGSSARSKSRNDRLE
jgi:hypothetical protein